MERNAFPVLLLLFSQEGRSWVGRATLDLPSPSLLINLRNEKALSGDNQGPENAGAGPSAHEGCPGRLLLPRSSAQSIDCAQAARRAFLVGNSRRTGGAGQTRLT